MADKTTNATQVIGELKAFTDREVIRLVFEVTATLIEDTPIKTGWARANWVPNINTPIVTPNGSQESVSTGAQKDGLAKVLAKYKLPSLVYISNNVAYISKLNDGTSTQAPAGFVQTAIAKAIKEVT